MPSSNTAAASAGDGKMVAGAENLSSPTAAASVGSHKVVHTAAASAGGDKTMIGPGLPSPRTTAASTNEGKLLGRSGIAKLARGFSGLWQGGGWLGRRYRRRMWQHDGVDFELSDLRHLYHDPFPLDTPPGI
jgi:hypothetical protein